MQDSIEFAPRADGNDHARAPLFTRKEADELVRLAYDAADNVKRLASNIAYVAQPNIAQAILEAIHESLRVRAADDVLDATRTGVLFCDSDKLVMERNGNAIRCLQASNLLEIARRQYVSYLSEIAQKKARSESAKEAAKTRAKKKCQACKDSVSGIHTCK